jgi:hypothetical protein
MLCSDVMKLFIDNAKTYVQLSTGTLVFSITFVREVLKRTEFGLLKGSWICFLISGSWIPRCRLVASRKYRLRTQVQRQYVAISCRYYRGPEAFEQ